MCFEPQVLIFRRIQLYTCSIWYCHSMRVPGGHLGNVKSVDKAITLLLIIPCNICYGRSLIL